MSVSDLTNTTWLLNDEISWINNDGFSSGVSITFTSNNNSYNYLVFENVDEDFDDYYLGYQQTTPYRYDTCYYASGRYGYTNLNITDTDYQQITITGGTDVTNSDFITWLQNNGTLQESGGGGDTTTSTGKIGDLPIIKKHFGNLEIIKEVLNGVTIYEKEAQPTQSYSVTFTSSGYWYNQTAGKILIYDGQDTTGTLILDQNPANKSAFPITLTINSGYCCISIEGPFVAIGNGVTSNDYTIGIIWDAPNTIKRRKATIDKNGTININVDDFNF